MEFKQLQLLRDDVLKLEEILNHPSKDSAVLIAHYKNHAQALELYSERIERQLDIWIKGLEGLITTEERILNLRERNFIDISYKSWKMTVRDRQYFES